jgi:hypothetical protein
MPFLRAFGCAVLLLVISSCLILSPSVVIAFTDAEIAHYQSAIGHQDIGKRIAFWAEKFIGTPYDRDPEGEYVTKRAIVADDRVDCMYLVFRASELALAETPDDAIKVALDKRFHTGGVLQKGIVANYEDRFEYGEDMIDSGKWGREITAALGRTRTIRGTRGKGPAQILSPRELRSDIGQLKSGDLIFFIKVPAKRTRQELVGHIGIVKVEIPPGSASRQRVYLIHASGTKKRGGGVKKVLLEDYLRKMPYIGVRITRF